MDLSDSDWTLYLVSVLDLAFTPERTHPAPIYLQLADYLRELIATGRLRPGEKLPATRELASGLGIGRNTASQAYQVLADDGVLLAQLIVKRQHKRKS